MLGEIGAVLMAFDYTKPRSTANTLLKKFGQAVTLIKVVPGTYNPAAGTVSNTTTTQYGTGAIIEWAANQIDGSLIRATDKRLLLSPLNSAGAVLTAPVLGDTVTDAAGVVYTLVEPLKTVSPAGTAVLFDCNLRA